ncbi:hypothetical protein BT96DRAFT_1078888 [Gymnopus androsaceus JB14]|uniref:Reverse transcriptase zinc-binding domain-containing protein n=1 Tax=Gymnopus androsaceus JB14 TaxID=1447944 RepID=A0A6A4GQW7_9AGAR|nr:hypothetical protein BT96DRAFT_1078888 [Gymnopus androsaceus JB14]
MAQVQVATAASCIREGESDARAGAGLFFQEANQLNRSAKLPLFVNQSKKAGEAVAVKLAADTIDPKLSIHLKTSSKFIRSFIESPSKLEDEDFLGKPTGIILKSLLTSLRMRITPTLIKELKRNEKTHPEALAKAAISKTGASYINISQPPTLRVTGAKLSVMTQSLAYKMIKAQQAKKDGNKRIRTERNLERVKECVEDKFGYSPTYEAFWKAIRTKDFERKVRDFLWMITHDAYWTGTHWLRDSMKPELKERAICPLCGKIDDFRHILTECESPGQATIWKLAGSLWEMKKSTIPWAYLALGDILGSSLARITAPGTERVLVGESRLWKILIVESAYLIWTMRCERVIANEHAPFSEMEVENRWIRMMNERLEIDCQMTDGRYGKKALSKKLVMQTWKGTLKDEGTLPEDWTTKSGVLVGISRGQSREEVSGVG